MGTAIMSLRSFRSHRLPRAAVAAAIAFVVMAPLVGRSQERVDLDAIYQIKDEGLQRSQVMEILSYLTDVHGPRLTGSPNLKAAADYVATELRRWGLTNVALEPWGPFGRGWTNDRFVGHALTPQAYPLIAYPKAWTPGTNGPVTAEAVIAIIETEEDFKKYEGQLRGKFVLTAAAREVEAHFEPQGRRFTDAGLDELARQPGPRRPPPPQRREVLDQGKRLQFFLREGVAALLEPGRGDGGTVFVGSGGSRDPKGAPVPPQVVLAVEHYNRLVRTLEKKIPVTLLFDIKNTFHDETLDSFNIVAEVAGSDKVDELVMLGAHFDSWHAGTGTTDNATGSAVMLEAMRILKATGLKMRRTVRLALWTGEEQGLLGSRAYVKQHLADRETMALKAAHAKLAGYFNVDNGTGAIRGVYLQGNEAVAPIFRAWMEPFSNLGMTTLAIRGTGGTDHLAFDAVGLPGFQFIQDPVEYETRTHHSNMDVYERAQAADLMKNAVIVAAFAYHAANRDERLPRKPLPKPQPPQKTTTTGSR